MTYAIQELKRELKHRKKDVESINMSIGYHNEQIKMLNTEKEKTIEQIHDTEAAIEILERQG